MPNAIAISKAWTWRPNVVISSAEAIGRHPVQDKKVFSVQYRNVPALLNSDEDEIWYLQTAPEISVCRRYAAGQA